MGSFRRYVHPHYNYKSKREQKKRLLILSGIIATLIIFTIRFVLTLPYFYVRNVQIEGLKRLSASQLVWETAIPPHTSIFSLDINKIYQKIKSQPLVKEVIIKKKLPSTLVISIKERSPYVYVKTKERFWEIDREGVILKSTEKNLKNLPLIEGIDPIKNRKKLLKILNILKLCQLLKLNVGKVSVERGDRGIVVYIGDIQVIFGEASNYNYLSYVPDIIEDARRRKEKLTYIDLRFNGQIISSG